LCIAAKAVKLYYFLEEIIMMTQVKKEKGFTLIELMIVVAIIGILAAIAIPQFSTYRLKAFNSAAQSDLRNIMTSEEAAYAESQSYVTIGTASAISITATAKGTSIGSLTSIVASITSLPGAKLSKGVFARSTVTVPTGKSATDYSIATKHVQGDKVYEGQASKGITPTAATAGNYF